MISLLFKRGFGSQLSIVTNTNVLINSLYSPCVQDEIGESKDNVGRIDEFFPLFEAV